MRLRTSKSIAIINLTWKSWKGIRCALAVFGWFSIELEAGKIPLKGKWYGSVI